jgi:hypothetical protein
MALVLWFCSLRPNTVAPDNATCSWIQEWFFRIPLSVLFHQPTAAKLRQWLRLSGDAAN